MFELQKIILDTSENTFVLGCSDVTMLATFYKYGVKLVVDRRGYARSRLAAALQRRRRRLARALTRRRRQQHKRLTTARRLRRST